MMDVMVDLYCTSYPTPPAAVTLDIDETVDVVHGGQQLSFWNGHYGERCFLPLHVYDTATGRPVAMLLRTGKHAAIATPVTSAQCVNAWVRAERMVAALARGGRAKTLAI